MIITFFVSLSVLFVLFALKAIDIKIRKIGFLSRLWAWGDRKIGAALDAGIYRYNRYKKISRIFLFDFVPSYVYELLVKMKDQVSKKYYSSADNFRGRRVLRTTGNVSFFLERLGDDKQTN
jgi:hypothetical protein